MSKSRFHIQGLHLITLQEQEATGCGEIFSCVVLQQSSLRQFYYLFTTKSQNFNKSLNYIQSFEQLRKNVLKVVKTHFFYCNCILDVLGSMENQFLPGSLAANKHYFRQSHFASFESECILFSLNRRCINREQIQAFKQSFVPHFNSKVVKLEIRFREACVESAQQNAE